MSIPSSVYNPFINTLPSSIHDYIIQLTNFRNNDDLLSPRFNIYNSITILILYILIILTLSACLIILEIIVL